ncbi:hypothetical protein G5C60_31820 [Streptomyces sp. HC44]|uniref:PPM-type phosphatase domain-containing protein n=1 Tax=Streptomyces scabichelini TaxID=2711217 RepID=A0A6G4VD94_9ACTN|nr:protein phosphatase 2C domain-containing protein [Streptomyces scabichelini]NGO12069.1 hypothetical protein [Streptomyces scabichelini]
MSQQGETPTGHEDDWWRQLYDDSTEDTGPAAAADSLDDRFASAAGTVGAVPHQGPADGLADGPAGGSVGGPVGGGTAAKPPSSGPPGGNALRRSGLQRQRAPWEAPPPEPTGPMSFPPAPKSSAFPTEASHGDTSTETPGAAVPESRAPTGGPVGPSAAVTSADAGRSSAHSVPADARPSSVPSAPSAPSAPERAQPDPSAGRNPSAGRADTPADVPIDASYGKRAGPPAGGPPATLVDALSKTPTDAPPKASSDVPSDAPSTTDAPPTPAITTVDYVGSGPPTYEAEPTALPPADPDDLDDLVADTVLDGAHYGTCTLRAASVRGDSARYRGEPRRDSLLTARFGTGEQALVLVAMATGARATPDAHRAAAEACQWIGRAVGRSHPRLAEDIRAARRGDLKSGLHRLTDRSLGKLRATAAEQGIDPEEYTASLRCLLLPADPECRTRVFFGVGAGGLFRLRDGEWQDIEPRVAETTGEAVVGFGSLPSETPEGDRLTMDLGIATPPSPYEPAPVPPRAPFRFRASVARPGDTLLLCTGGMAEPLRGEPGLARHLTARWTDTEPPGLAAFLADVQVRVKGYADDRTAAAVWEA